MSALSQVFSRGGGGLPEAVRAEGTWIFDREGRRYLDASGGAAVVNVGHGRREIAEAMSRQAAAVAYVHGTQFTSAVLEEYAARLAPHAPPGCSRLYPVSGGSEAVETAVKLARAWHLARGDGRRTKVVGRSTGYHGATLGVLGIAGREVLQDPFAPLLARSPRAAAAFCYHCPLGLAHPACGLECADDLARLLDREGPDTVAAFVVEPVIGASAGAAVAPEGYLRAVRDTCRRHGVLFVADEVMSGFGRTGAWFASAAAGLDPDLVTCGKGMSSGYVPAGGVLARGEIADAVRAAGTFRHGFTFSHHPVVAAACLATLEILERERLVERAAAMGPRLGEGLRRLLGHPHVGDVRGTGMLWGVEVVEDRAARRPFPRSAQKAERLAARARARGVIVYPSTGCADGREGDLILVAPPFVIEEADLVFLADALDAALSDEGL